MKPKEKAKELIDRFKSLSQKKCDCLEYSCTCFRVPTYKAKEMVLIAVDEILNNDGFTQFDNYLTDYWKEVKQEIQNL
tara:strand:- start:5 stop:238 length:234 start_codon:yes stop_codon:yes gene_type:complete